MLFIRNYFKYQDTDRLNIKEWEMVYHVNTIKKEVWVDILISDMIDFQVNNITREKKDHFIMLKESMCQEDIILKIYIPNYRASEYIKNWQKSKENRQRWDLYSDLNTSLPIIDM